MLFTCRTGLGLQFQTMGSVSGSVVSELGFSYAELGTLIGLFMLPGLLLALPAGYLGRFLPDRVLVGLAFLSLAAGGLIAAVAEGFGLMALGRFAAGTGYVISTISLTDRTGKRDQLVYVCTAVSVLSLLLLAQTQLAVMLSLLFGLAAGAPAGVIMALTGEAMAPHRRAFGMGAFFSLQFVIMMLAPPIAGWLFDRSADPFWPILFAAGLFAASAMLYRLFWAAKHRVFAA